MRYGSVCSGIEAASVAWEPLGWTPAFVSEIEPFPRRVLAHRWPGVHDLGDFTKIGSEHGPIDLLVGGTPCQSFSVAGLRQGLADPRGNLMLEFGALARRVRARWLVWENVPGVLSSNGGRDFGSFLGMLGELGYGFAYRVLDAQFFGVAQRRRRVFVVGHAGGLWQRAAAVLFEPESLRGDPAPRREAGEGSAPALAARTRGGGGLGTDFDLDGGLIARSLNAHASRSDAETETMIPFAFCNTGGDTALGMSLNGVPPLTSRHGDPGNVVIAHAVRRLTPRECERLQGFPDDYTAIPGAKDGPRYKALGNSMAVPVMRWIGERIQMVEDALGGAP